MKYTKNEILRGAFSEFIARGYDSTTISDLQKKLNISRGGMYRHFKNKEDLFNAVMDEYVFRHYERMTLAFSSDIKLPDLIKLLHKRRKDLIESLIETEISYSSFLNFSALIIQAAKYYPDFATKFGGIVKSMHKGWQRALENSIEAGDIRKDSNVKILSSIFTNICISDSKHQIPENDSDFTEGMIKQLREKNQALLYIYSLIKT